RNQPSSSSDHASFRRAGIPVLMFTAPNVSLIHSAHDILEEVNHHLLRDTVRLAVSLLRLPTPSFKASSAVVLPTSIAVLPTSSALGILNPVS
ncbi:MAG: M28 family peptidase, partial [Dehalococcoidia bacterium]